MALKILYVSGCTAGLPAGASIEPAVPAMSLILYSLAISPMPIIISHVAVCCLSLLMLHLSTRCYHLRCAGPSAVSTAGTPSSALSTPVRQERAKKLRSGDREAEYMRIWSWGEQVISCLQPESKKRHGCCTQAAAEMR